MTSQIDSIQCGVSKEQTPIRSTGTVADSSSITVQDEHVPSLTDEPKSKTGWFSFLIGDIHTDDDPMALSNARKQMIIFVVALSGISGPLGSMIYMPGLLSVASDLDTTSAAVNGTVSSYVVFMGVAPLIWASLSDFYGRKRMYLLSILLSIVAAIICARAVNIAMLIVFRALQSAGASASQTLGAGVIADTIPVARRGRAYGFFYIGPLIGPVIGPTIGGFLCQYLGWRSTFYFLAILGAVLFALVAVFLPETLRKKKDVENKQAAHSVFRAFAPMIGMLGDPTILVITAYSTVIFGCLYLLNPTITDTFQTLYGYNEWQVGLCYLAFGVGLMVGSVLAGQYSDYMLRRLRAKNQGKVIAEMRLRAAVPSFFLIPAGYLIYGWTTQKAIGVYAPIIGLFVYALGQMSAFTPSNVYLVDSQPGRSASAVGINNCFRSIVAAIVTIFSTDALHNLGPGILYTIVAAVNIVNIVFVVIAMIFGQRWREAYDHKKRQNQGEVQAEKPPLTTVEAADENHRDMEHTMLARTGSRHSVV
ncbi:major facilitator superfamily domain-containing protein [Syncephalastrum racemosum]|uniref:Major facilitator superfamily domain-containing protein n=1 Tax=Syncephalastrum racemosum TaxID=13706 RepID=A0A1X2H1X0_SYNRA|nr:major facilitator superfamily domain-containing protein [Syncephalastrum racemosum]